MNMKILSLPLIALGLSLSACSGANLNDDAFAPKGNVDAILSASSEKVKFSVEDELALQSLEDWIREDAPTRAVVSCIDSGDTCSAVRSVLKDNQVSFNLVDGDSYQVELVYERVVAKPCNPQFRSNHNNSDNLNHPAFGCATSMNVVQMVNDYRQFTNPAESDGVDAEMGVKTTRRYQGINDPYYPY